MCSSLSLRNLRRPYRWLQAALAALAGTLAQGVFAEGGIDAAAERSLIEEARSYEHGEGVPKDPLKAATLYCRAARAGDAEGQYSLGWMYANGRGLARDDAHAAALFELAAAQGHAYAERMLRFVAEGDKRLPDCMREEERQTLALADDDDESELTPARRRIVEMVNTLAPGYAVHPKLALAIITAESNFNPNARSPKNAAGLMQLIPETAERFKVKNVLDPAQNIRGGLAYLRWLLSYYRGQVPLAIAAYNAGEGAVDRYRGIPPYRETRDYVQKVLRIFKRQDHPYDDSVTPPSSAFFAPAPGRASK
jgi:hypothetical protein